MLNGSLWCDLNAASMPKIATETLTYPEAAKYCGIDENLLRRNVSRRRVRALRLGHRTIRFRKADLDAFLDRCATTAA